MNTAQKYRFNPGKSYYAQVNSIRKNRQDNPPYHNSCLRLSSEFIQKVITGNSYLLKISNGSISRQLRDLKKLNITTSRSTITRLQNGTYKTASLVILFYFSEYHNLSVIDLYYIGRDLLSGETPDLDRYGLNEAKIQQKKEFNRLTTIMEKQYKKLKRY